MNLHRLVLLLLLCILTTVSPARSSLVFAQTADKLTELKKEITKLMDEQRYLDALPLLQELVMREPSNPDGHFHLGFSLLAQANNLRDEAERKNLRSDARKAFIKARDLGGRQAILEGIIASLAEDGSAGNAFSQNPEAQALMVEGEAYFSQGKLQDAFDNYQKALKLDPNLYEAALFSGDIYLHQNDWKGAETWYQKAIGIDPFRETAYRYSATPFMRQGKLQDALERYIQAFVTEPYNQLALSGLVRWADAAQVPIGHPRIEIPVQVTLNNGQTKVDISASLLTNLDDGSAAWVLYGGLRSEWAMKKFAATFPEEKIYRHSLAEEADALRGMLKSADSTKKKELNPQLALLKKLEGEGLLEAFILISIPDEGIAQDHRDYLKANREKLVRYVNDYIVEGRK